MRKKLFPVPPILQYTDTQLSTDKFNNDYVEKISGV